MSETNIARSSRLDGERLSIPLLEIQTPIAEQLLLHLDLPGFSGNGSTPLTAPVETQKSSGNASRRQEVANLNAEVTHLRTLVNRQLERIRHLEQALDQSLSSLKEARTQLIDQQFLEEQLAATESIANVQQQAIVQLQYQLIRQQAEFNTQRISSTEQDPTLRVVLDTMGVMTQTQQGELERLRKQMVRDREDFQTYQHQLEQQLTSAQSTIQRQQCRIAELEAWLSAHAIDAEPGSAMGETSQLQFQTLFRQLEDQQVGLNQMETELRQAHVELQEQQLLIENLKRLQPSSLTTGTDAPADLKTAHFRIEELEVTSEQQQNRIVELERQTAEMQEQILQQAQQASEYETAIQHWKDRYHSHQNDLLTVKQLLEQTMPDPPSELMELLAHLTAEGTDQTAPSHHLSPLGIHSRFDLPDFLIRRTRHKRQVSQ